MRAHLYADTVELYADTVELYADTVERLFTEFDGRVSLPVIGATVHECREQLCSSPEAAMPELLERLARQRLISDPRAVPLVSTSRRHPPVDAQAALRSAGHTGQGPHRHSRRRQISQR